MPAQTKDLLEPSSFWKFLKQPQVISLLISIGILEFSLGPFSIMSIIYLTQIVEFSVYLVSIANVIATLLGMIVLFSIGKLLDRSGRKPFLVFSIFSYSIFFTLFYFLSNYKVAIFILWLVPLYPFRAPTVSTIMSDLTAERERARGMALIQYEQVVTTNIGAIIGGLVADLTPVGLQVVPIFPAAIAVIAFLVAFITIKETNVKYLERKKEKERLEG